MALIKHSTSFASLLIRMVTVQSKAGRAAAQAAKPLQILKGRKRRFDRLIQIVTQIFERLQPNADPNQPSVIPNRARSAAA